MGIARRWNTDRNLCGRRRQGKHRRQDRVHWWRRRRRTEKGTGKERIRIRKREQAPSRTGDTSAGRERGNKDLATAEKRKNRKGRRTEETGGEERGRSNDRQRRSNGRESFAGRATSCRRIGCR